MGHAAQPEPPEHIEHAGSTRYNACRIYGRIIAYGVTYLYDKEADRLIRQDLWKAYRVLKKSGALDDLVPGKPD